MSEGLECPITFESYGEKGDRQPVMLPDCGHTFSRAAVRGLIEAQRGKTVPGPSHRKGKPKTVPFVCPTCNKPQTKVHQIEDCPPNWALIQRITDYHAQNPEQKAAAEKRQKEEEEAKAKRREEEKKQAEIERKAQEDKLRQDKLELERKEAEARLAAERERERLEQEERQRAEAKAARLAAEVARSEALLQEKKQEAAAAAAEAEKRSKGGKEKASKTAKKGTGAGTSAASEAGPSTSHGTASDTVAGRSTPDVEGPGPSGKSESANAPNTPEAQAAAEAQSSSKSNVVTADSDKASTSAVGETSPAPADPKASSKATPVVAEGPRKVPKILSKNRGSQLSKSDILLNLRALEEPMATLIERTLKPLLPPADCSTVSKALGVLAVRDSKNGQAVLQIMTKKLNLLQLMSDLWKKIPTMDKVENLEDIDKRVLERMHPQLCEHYSELMRIERSKVTADMVLNSAPGALQLVQLHIAANVVDKMYATLTNCKGFDLEDDKGPPRTGEEAADAEELRMEKLQAELEDATATDAISGLCSDGEHILMPQLLLKVAAEVLIPRQGRFTVPDTAQQTILTDVLKPRVHAAIAIGYDEAVASKHNKRVASFICEHSAGPDSTLALRGSCIAELPEVVDSSLDYLKWSEPDAFAGLELVEGGAAAAAAAAGGMHTVIGDGPSGPADDSTAVEEAEVDTAASSAAAAAAAAAPEGVASPSTPTDAVDNTQGKEDSKAGKDTPAKGKKAAGGGGFMRGFLGGRPGSASSGRASRPGSATKPAHDSAPGEDGGDDVPALVDASAT